MQSRISRAIKLLQKAGYRVESPEANKMTSDISSAGLDGEIITVAPSTPEAFRPYEEVDDDSVPVNMGGGEWTGEEPFVNHLTTSPYEDCKDSEADQEGRSGDDGCNGASEDDGGLHG